MNRYMTAAPLTFKSSRGDKPGVSLRAVFDSSSHLSKFNSGYTASPAEPVGSVGL